MTEMSSDIDNINVSKATVCDSDDCRKHFPVPQSNHLIVLTQNIRSINCNLRVQGFEIML